MTTNSKPSRIIKIDKHTNKVALPTILLQNRSFDTIGKLNYTDFNASLVANGVDEVSFEVHKYVDGKECPIWDSIQDLKVIHVEDYGKFEISVNYTDSTETTKSIHGQSLEVELGQISLHEFHVNDEVDFEMNDYIPTVFWNTDDPAHSLLHRVLADKAPHWSWGKVTSKIALDEESKPESSSTFQRTYTADGETIYDFLTGTVAEESNVIFEFDTFHRKINCYSLCDCIDQDTGEVICKGIGEDTNVLVSKNKLVNEISISSDKDSVKNCFKIEGGDDVISDMVRAVSMSGSNYINIFSEFQLNDMPEELRDKLVAYQAKISDQSLQDQYYGENGIYTRICKAYEDLSYYESSMMPNVEIKETTAEEQYNLVKQQLINNHVGIYSFGSYTSTGFTGVTNSVEDMANVYVDARYEVTIIDKNLKYEHSQNSTTGKWTGNIKVTHVGDETNFYPKTEEQENATFSVVIEDDKTEMLYTKQKIEKALSKGSMFDIDFEVANMNETQMRDYFNKYSLNRLKSFAEGYNSCLSVLMQVGETTTSEVQSTLYDEYFMRYRIITNPPTSDNPNPTLGVLEIRQAQVDDINKEIDTLEQLQQNFQDDNELNLESFLGEDLYLEFCKYRREDTYSNSNYVSDGLSIAECIKKAKELIDVATKEAKKACVLQRTVSTSLNNLFALPEFEPLYDSFALFNYIRVRTEDELLKLRLIGIEFNGDSIEEINVTFSDQIESIDGSLSDAQSIYQQMSSIATSFPSTARQAKQGESANKEIIDIYEHGMNATKSMITNNDNNEVTITNAGLIAKRMDDAGSYGDKQLRITGNGMYLTDDSWRTLTTAIGEIVYENPFTGEKVQGYGVLAPALIGNLIAGKQLYIGNENGSVLITGEGIKITNGTITWGNVNAPDISDIDGLDDKLQQNATDLNLYKEEIAEFQTSVDNQLSTLNGAVPTTKIGEDYIISPKIGGGYLYIANNNYSVEIDPNHTNSNAHGDYLFCVKNKIKTTDNIIMGVANNGDGYFSGKITAITGEIGGWKINSNGIYSGSTNTSDGDMIYIYSYGNSKGIRCASTKDVSGNYNKSVFTSGGIYFYDNEELMCSLYSNRYVGQHTGTSNKGTALNSASNSKYIAFCNKNSESEGNYTTPFLLNFGLNPNGYTEDVIIYGNTRSTGNIYLNGALHYDNGTYLNDMVGGGLYCSNQFDIEGKLCVGHTSYGNYMLNVKGNAYIDGNLTVSGTGVVNTLTDNAGNAHRLSLGWTGSKLQVLVDSTYLDIERAGHNLWSHTITWTDAGNARTNSSSNDSDYNLACVQWIKDNYQPKASDERVKSNFQSLPENINQIFDSLSIRQYEYKDGLGRNGFYFGDTAQHINHILTEHGLNPSDYAVTGIRPVDADSNETNYIEKDDCFHYIDDSNILWLCVDQIQKLKKEIQELKGEN